jgi:hypothetical protein
MQMHTTSAKPHVTASAVMKRLFASDGTASLDILVTVSIFAPILFKFMGRRLAANSLCKLATHR